MSGIWISAERIFDGERFFHDHAVLLESGRVKSVRSCHHLQAPIARHCEGILMPGFFDLQVNGGGGVQLNSRPTREGIARIAAAHRALGTVALLPTVITDKAEVLARAVEAAIASRDVAGVIGLHIEGPHLSRARRGTHDPQFIRPMDGTTMNHVADLRRAGLRVLITVAPESTSFQQISQLADLGAVVALGHTDTDAETVGKALKAGAKCFTHLFNAMSPMLNREPGVTGAAIASDAWCSIIADGKHVDPIMIGIAARARPLPDRMIAVSDAMATVGGPDQFELYGKTIRVRDGRLINLEGSLAGTHVAMVESARNLVSFGIDEEETLRMCRRNPAELFGIWPEMSLVGLDAEDLILLSNNLDLVQVGFADGETLRASL